MGISQSPSLRFLLPSKIISTSFIAYSFFVIKSTLQLSSHNCPIDIKDKLLSSGRTITVFATSDSFFESGKIHFSSEEMVEASGRMTEGP